MKDAILAHFQNEAAQVETMIEQHKSRSAYIASSNDGRPVGEPNAEDLDRLERKLASMRADIADIENHS